MHLPRIRFHLTQRTCPTFPFYTSGQTCHVGDGGRQWSVGATLLKARQRSPLPLQRAVEEEKVWRLGFIWQCVHAFDDIAV